MNHEAADDPAPQHICYVLMSSRARTAPSPTLFSPGKCAGLGVLSEVEGQFASNRGRSCLLTAEENSVLERKTIYKQIITGEELCPDSASLSSIKFCSTCYLGLESPY